MEFWESFAQMVGNYGFSTVCCAVLMYYIKYTEDKHREELARLNEEHRKEADAMTEAISNNTKVLEKLYDRFLTMGVSNEHIN